MISYEPSSGMHLAIAAIAVVAIIACGFALTRESDKRKQEKMEIERGNRRMRWGMTPRRRSG